MVVLVLAGTPEDPREGGEEDVVVEVAVVAVCRVLLFVVIFVDVGARAGAGGGWDDGV